MVFPNLYGEASLNKANSRDVDYQMNIQTSKMKTQKNRTRTRPHPHLLPFQKLTGVINSCPI